MIHNCQRTNQTLTPGTGTLSRDGVNPSHYLMLRMSLHYFEQDTLHAGDVSCVITFKLITVVFNVASGFRYFSLINGNMLGSLGANSFGPVAAFMSLNSLVRTCI